MISQMTTTEMTDRSVVAASPLGVSLRGAGLLSCTALLPVTPVRGRSERPTMALAVAAAKAEARDAYAFAAAANGAGVGQGALGANGQIEQQKKTQHGKWAFRGLEPWSDPA